MSGSLSAETLQMGYFDDSGFEKGPGQFKADYLRIAEMVLQDTGLALEWVKLPYPRMIRRIQAHSGATNFCISGLTITTERQSIGQFSAPFRIDRMLELVGLRKQAEVLSSSHSFADLVAKDRYSFLTIVNLNYGEALAPILQKLGDRLSNSASSTQHIYDMLLRGRGDFAIVTKNFGDIVLAERSDRDQFISVTYPDLRRDVRMGFLCNFAVDAAVMQKINTSIAKKMPLLRQLYPDQEE